MAQHCTIIDVRFNKNERRYEMKKGTWFVVVVGVAVWLDPWNCVSAQRIRQIHSVWRPLPSAQAGELLAERVELWRKNRLWHMADSGYLLSGFESRPGRHPWQGEHVGKWLHAATLAYEQTRDDKLGKTLRETVERLLASQEPNGYLGTYGSAIW